LIDPPNFIDRPPSHTESNTLATGLDAGRFEHLQTLLGSTSSPGRVPAGITLAFVDTIVV